MTRSSNSPTVFACAEAVRAAIGHELGVSDWLTITQDRIDRFAEATGDHQWIHVDPVRAAAGPFGRCIAHGYLTLSLLPHFLPQLVRYEGLRMSLNYGCDRVRFPAPVPVGSRLRGRGVLTGAEPAGDGLQVRIRLTIEIEGGDKPACVVDAISRVFFAA